MEAGKWDLDSIAGRLALAYIESMWRAPLTTVGLENGFNDLRDNEARGARHKARGEQTLQALAMSSLAHRYEHGVECTTVEPEDVSHHAGIHCTNGVFLAKDACTSAGRVGVD